MVRKIFKRRVIATAGPLPGQLTVENLKIWTKLRGGVFHEGFDDKLRAGNALDDPDEAPTHLLCTEVQFNKLKKKAPLKQILTKHKRLHILHYDWYEFSCTENKKLPESEYSMRDVLAKERAAKRERDRVERGKREAEKFVNTNFFHVYFDREAFPYQITITREGEDGEVERYEMTLWESNAKPSLYQFTAKYLKRKGCSQPSYHRPSPCAGKWRGEMNLFMDFFRIKTGVLWQDRVMLQGTTGAESFQYQPPTGGKPVGRRLRLPYWECMEINARERGLPWPPIQEVEVDKAEDEDMPDLEEDDDSTPDEDVEEVKMDGDKAMNDNEDAEDVAMDLDDDMDSGVSICDSFSDKQEKEPDAIEGNTLANDDQGHQQKDAKTDSNSDGQDAEMKEGDSGISVHDSDTEPKKSNVAISLASYVHETDPVEWKDAVKFIDHMNERLATARERVCLADEAILDARAALPGYIRGYLLDY